MHGNIIRICLVLAMTVLVAACQSSNPIQNTQLNDQHPLKLGQGVVALELINNTDRLGNLHPNWGEVIIIRIDNEEQRKQAAIAKAKEKALKKGKTFDPEAVDWEHEYFSLRPNSKGTVSSQLFVGAMPEGEYLIGSLYSYYNDGNMSSWITMPVFQSAGVFEVKATQLTNLGTIVFQPLLNTKEPSFWSNRTEQRAYVTRLSGDTDLAPFVKHHYQNLASSMDFSSINSWKEDPFTELRAKLGSLSKSNAYGERAIALQGSELNALAARFGLLHLINGQGDLTTESLPTSSQLTSSLHFQGNLLVGSERGLLFSKAQNGQWQSSQPISAKEAFVWLGSANGFGYALASSQKQHVLYRFAGADTRWQKIGEFKKKANNNWLVQNGGLFVFFDAQGEPKIINDNKLLSFNEATNSWQATKYKSFKKFSQLKTGELIAVEVSQWDGFGDQVISLDYGQSWQTIERSTRLFGDAKADATLPALLPNNQIASVGRVKTVKGSKKNKLRIITADIQNASDKTKWTPHGELKANCSTQLAELTQGSTLFFLCDQGQVVSTSDLGQSWDVRIDIDIARMQAQYEAFLASQKKEAKANSDEKL
ncbi:hypothetical protein [Pseudoalteromonas luteoviolacea]|uniref:BNR/Asp-box repeat protein n=1 Tax=Pseudoalteromonas luteoviolacea (strain 2ta16) TaxID=1353533 RepID=V4HMY4_PSEL2|nr:hypothetical protein [Pseudoalteromonas luteoviolacea]ESP92190.1 hypothetical protein PL2TA16_05027 [Pseudoalteromonas luteoviolacea 2ta16]KZN29296.1 hypothetical protein N483_07630 [Pseudoalteromonas luteoviolacea NCIMB 1944]